jgi:hypothetical protein
MQASSADQCTYSAVAGGVAQSAFSGTSDPTDGKWKEFRGTYQQDNFHLYVDGVEEGTPDVSGSVPAVTRIEVGASATGGNAANALVRFRLFSKPTTKKVTEFA